MFNGIYRFTIMLQKKINDFFSVFDKIFWIMAITRIEFLYI